MQNQTASELNGDSMQGFQAIDLLHSAALLAESARQNSRRGELLAQQRQRELQQRQTAALLAQQRRQQEIMARQQAAVTLAQTAQQNAFHDNRNHSLFNGLNSIRAAGNILQQQQQQQATTTTTKRSERKCKRSCTFIAFK